MINDRPETVHEAIVAAVARAGTAQQLGKIISILEGNFLDTLRKVHGENKRLTIVEGLVDELNEI